MLASSRFQSTFGLDYIILNRCTCCLLLSTSMVNPVNLVS